MPIGPYMHAEHSNTVVVDKPNKTCFNCGRLARLKANTMEEHTEPFKAVEEVVIFV